MSTEPQVISAAPSDVSYDVLILGAGAAGLMCAWEAAKRGAHVLVLDHASKAAGKIRISGGGRCNFTNLDVTPKNFLSQNTHFCISALKRFTSQDFINRVAGAGIAYHEKTLGQLFCDDSSQQIIDMLLEGCDAAGAKVQTKTKIIAVAKTEGGFTVNTDRGAYKATQVVVATGGPSIPKMGSSGFGYKLAEQFGLKTISPRAGLVPLTFEDKLLEQAKELAGVSVDAEVSCGKVKFAEGLLFTHRGLSGPSILQISSYWTQGTPLTINLAPTVNLFDLLRENRKAHPKQDIRTVLSHHLPRRLVESICHEAAIEGRLADLSDKRLRHVSDRINAWRVVPKGTEGYRTAEVTLGGVDTSDLSSKTFEAKQVPGLYFIGEVVDVTGHLGGFNFQWAWASGFAAGQSVRCAD
ncbi:MAG: NAD(P)/FAD-dependent oxidoreductase [Parvibaculaceae bacterium]|nr:NAD(P)/FAD-dependent oxidoreductase [Parvibaculaceae bacterium]